MDCHGIWYFSIFQKSVETIEIWLKSDKNTGHFPWRPIHFFYLWSRPILLRMRTISYRSRRENQNTHFLFNTYFPKTVPLTRQCKGILVGPDRPQMAIRCMAQWKRIACWITTATDTQSEYVILIASPQQKLLRERASILLLYVYRNSCLRCVVVFVKIGQGRVKCHS
jgi:hypothetical protein